MQELTFETILRLPQMELKKRLKAELKSRGYHITDKPGYLYAGGTIPVLLVAHMDTVHRQPVEQICYSADGAVTMSPQGIGGDDRCGVWMILQILRTAKCHVLFCEDEEVGCVGAKKFTRGSLRPQVNYIVELDRRGSNDAVFYRCDNPEFEDFVTSFGFETANGSCSDMRDEGETKLTPQEQSLNEEIEKLQDQWPYLMNEIFFIDYLKNPTYERGLAAKSKILVCFNDELLAAFLSAYKKANISEQQEMLTILKEISFRGGAVERDETDTEVTRKNLEKLENALNSEVEHTSDAVKKFYANRHLETVKQIRQKFLNTREM